MTTVLIAEDEPTMLELESLVLAEAGYKTLVARNGEQAVWLFSQEPADLCILDVMMPRMDGYETCARIRELCPTVPVLFLSAKGDIDAKRPAFVAGADDYVTKPFDGEELVLRVEALLRRQRPAAAVAVGSITVGELTFNHESHELTVAGRKVVLTDHEYRIAELLAAHKGTVFSKEEIFKAVWGEDFYAPSVSIPVYIRRIREKVERDPSHPRYLKTIWRVGYYLDDEDA